jgi:hypothetical protein
MVRKLIGIGELIHLTVSPENATLEVDHELKDAIATANESSLRAAILEVCKQMPQASKVLSIQCRHQSFMNMRIFSRGVVPERVAKQEKRNLCGNCEIEEGEGDGCCKREMIRADEYVIFLLSIVLD